jgi:SOS-response transcriptional repressor LexA
MTPVQAKLYQYLVDRIDNPVGPTFEEMMVAADQQSKSGVARLLRALEEQGRITRTRLRERSVRAILRNSFDGVSSVAMIDELKRRGEWPNGG